MKNLPPGFRFHPTDEELILHYLKKKLTKNHVPCPIIADVDIYKFNPWDLPDQAAGGEKEWYFFSPRDRKYPNGARPNRAAASGYWKATGTDKMIVTSPGSECIGVKKALVFYKGKPPKGTKTNWIMHEYRLSDTSAIPKAKDSSMRLDDWVLCRIYKKLQSNVAQSTTSSDHDVDEEVATRQLTHEKLPAFEKLPSFSNLLETTDYSFISNLLVDAPLDLPFETSNQSFADMAPWDQSSFATGGASSSAFNAGHVAHPNAHMMGIENRQKRHPSGFVDEDAYHPSKKFVNPCNFSMELGQYNFVNHQMFLSPHISYNN